MGRPDIVENERCIIYGACACEALLSIELFTGTEVCIVRTLVAVVNDFLLGIVLLEAKS